MRTVKTQIQQARLKPSRILIYKHTEAYLNQIAEISETKLKVSQKKKMNAYRRTDNRGVRLSSETMQN